MGNNDLEIGKLRSKLTMDTAEFEGGSRRGVQRLGELVLGMTAAGKAASANGRLIAAMGQSGRQAADQLAAARRPLDAMALGMNAAGKEANASGRLIAGMATSGRQAKDSLDKLAASQLNANKTSGLLTSTLGKLTASFTVANLIDRGVGAVISMGKEAFQSAGHILDLENQTGLATDTIQRMQFVARQTGTELDAFTDSAFKLGVNLASGGGGVAGAVRDLHLSIDDLRKMNPSQQFETIVSSLGEVASEAERNRLGVALFGRQFSEIAASVGQGYDDIAKHAKVSSNAQLKALDDAGDRWQQFVANMKTDVQSTLSNFLLQRDAMIAVREEAKRLNQELTANEFDSRVMTRMLAGMAPQQPSLFTRAGEFSGVADLTYEEERAFEQLDEQVKKNIENQNRYTEEMKRFREELAQFQSAEFQQWMAIAATGGMPSLLSTGGLGTGVPLPSLGGLNDVQFGSNLPPGLRDPFLRQESTTRPGGWTVGNASAGGFDIGGVIQAALQGGGSVRGAIGGAAGGSLSRAVFGAGGDAGLSGIGISVATGAGKMFGDTVGKVVGSFLPGVGALVGPLLGKGISALAGLFGGGEGSKTNKMRDAEVKKFTGIENLAGAQDQLRKMAAEAGVTDAEIRKLFDTHKTKEFEQAFASVTGKIQEQEAIVAKYGLTWANFQGPKRAEEFSKALHGVEEETAALERVGLSHHDALQKTADAYVELAKQGIAAGTGIEPALAPVIEQLAEMGLLTDDMVSALNGVASDGLPTWKEMQEAAEKYGLKIDGMGGRYQQLLMTDQAGGILKDFEKLVKGGVPVENLIGEMGDEVNEFVRQAVAMGTEVPESMRHMLEQFQAAGELTDESGEKLKDLSGIQFAQPLQTAIQGLIDKMGELIDRIGGVGTAFAGLQAPEINGPMFVPPNAEEFAYPMAEGGTGRAMGPTLFYSRGGEDFAFSGEGKKFGGGGDAALTKQLIRTLRELPRRNAQQLKAVMANV